MTVGWWGGLSRHPTGISHRRGRTVGSVTGTGTVLPGRTPGLRERAGEAHAGRFRTRRPNGPEAGDERGSRKRASDTKRQLAEGGPTAVRAQHGAQS